MSFLRCPLCGKLTSLRNFDPEDFEDDIICVEMQSLGRGKGFEVVGEYSLLEDEEIMGKISSRVSKLNTVLDITDANELARLEDSIEELEDENKHLQAEFENKQKIINSMKNDHEMILEKVSESLDHESEFSDYIEAIEALLIDYEESLEELEG
jgi:molecular chaperone GrpE (heat shock protein)